LHIVAVAAFVRNAQTDISSIWNAAEGIIYVDQLPDFFQLKSNPKFAERPSQWIIDGLEKVPRPDVILTVPGDVLRGFFVHTHLVFSTGNGQPVALPLLEILQVSLTRSRFSDSDQLLVTFRNGRQISYVAIEGMIHLRTLHGRTISKHLHNLVSIVPGCPIMPIR
jgi:hypothetical protein